MSSKVARQRAAIGTSVVLAAFLAVGCGEDLVSTDSGFENNAPEMSISLSEPDGGMGIENESPGFGDAYFQNFLAEDLEVEIRDDPLAADAELRDSESRLDVEVKYVRLLWGNLKRGPEADT